MFIKKSREELNSQAIALLSRTDITNLGPGSRARALLEIVNEIVGELYDSLELNLLKTFITQADGLFLDWIGQTLDCYRVPGEADDDYRYRITQQVYAVAGSNETALRLKVLSIPGVYDVATKPFTSGTGSFHIYITPMDPNMGASIVADVQKVLDRNMAFGVNGIAALPKNVPFGIDITLIINNNTGNAGQIRNTVRRVVRDYVNGLLPGKELVVTDLTALIKQADTSIYDFRINSMTIRRSPVLVQNYQIYWDEKFVTSLNDIKVG